MDPNNIEDIEDCNNIEDYTLALDSHIRINAPRSCGFAYFGWIEKCLGKCLLHTSNNSLLSFIMGYIELVNRLKAYANNETGYTMHEDGFTMKRMVPLADHFMNTYPLTDGETTNEYFKRIEQCISEFDGVVVRLKHDYNTQVDNFVVYHPVTNGELTTEYFSRSKDDYGTRVDNFVVYHPVTNGELTTEYFSRLKDDYGTWVDYFVKIYPVTKGELTTEYFERIKRYLVAFLSPVSLPL